MIDFQNSKMHFSVILGLLVHSGKGRKYLHILYLSRVLQKNYGDFTKELWNKLLLLIIFKK